MKTFHTKVSNNYQGHYDFLGYVQNKDNNCFDANDEREVVTVHSSNLEDAIRHFFFRKVSFDIKKITKNGLSYLEAIPTEGSNITLEVAYCQESFDHLLGTNKNTYASFREARSK